MGSEARARIGLLFLLGITLLSFSQLYGNGDYPGPSLLGMAFAMGIAIGMRRVGAGAFTTLVASSVALISYLSWIFQGSDAWFLIPTPASIAGLVDSVQAALAKASVDYAPIPVRPGYVILTVIGMWMLTSIGEIATFRWRKPLAASLGPVALFSFVMVVGTRTAGWLLVSLFLIALFTYWSLEASHRLRSWGSWVSAWRDDPSNEPPVLTHSTARRMGASSVLIALVAPLFMPAIGDAFVSWKSGLGGDGEGGGGGSSGRINPMVSIETSLVEQSDQVMFEVTTEEASRWKLMTLEQYDPIKGQWTSAESNVTNLGGVEGTELILNDEPARGDKRTVEAEFQIVHLRGDEMPVRFPASEVEVLEGAEQRELQVKPENGDVSRGNGLTSDLVYRVRSEIPDLTYKNMRRANVGGDDVPAAYSSMGPQNPATDGLSPEVFELRERWTEGANTPYEKLVQIQDQFQGPDFTYDLDAGLNQADSDSDDPLATFLLDTKTGYCQQYATAFALLSRSLGYPTRIAVGFLPGSPQDPTVARPEQPVPEGQRVYEVTGNDAHAWPEVYFEDYGWVAFEPTHRDDVAAPIPSYTDPTPISPDPDVRISPERVQSGNPSERGQPQVPQGNIRRGGGSDAPGSENDPISDAWKKPFGRLALGVLVLLAAFLVAVPTLKSWRIKNRYRRARTPADRAAAAFAEFEQEANELATRRYRSESAPSFARRVAEVRKLDPAPAQRLASIYELAEYGGDSIAPNVADEARRIAASLRSTMWRGAGWWQRASRLFSPSGLRTES